MKNIIDWKNTELDGLPDREVGLLVIGDGFNSYALGKLSKDGFFTVQPFCGEVLYLHPPQVKLWAYLPKEDDENYHYAKGIYQIQYKQNGDWIDIPHNEITSQMTAISAKEQLENSLTFRDVELRLIHKYLLKSQLEYDFYKDFQG